MDNQKLTLTGTYNPRVMYHASGSTRRVDDPRVEALMTAEGWAFTPFPAPPEPEKPKDLQGQIDELRDLLMQHDAVLMKRNKK